MEGKWTLLGSLALGSLFATLAMVIPPAADPRASYQLGALAGVSAMYLIFLVCIPIEEARGHDSP